MKTVVYFSTIEEATEFVNKIEKLNSNFDILYGQNAIDAKSVLALLACDISKPLLLEYTMADGEENIVSEILKNYIK